MPHIQPGTSGHITTDFHPKGKTRLFDRPSVYESRLVRMGSVRFPVFRGERLYMIAFHKGKPLPKQISRWQNTVDDMLADIDVPKSRKLFLMVDEAFVAKGNTHRRPGAHIDGNWVEDVEAATHATGRVLQPETLLLASDVAGCVGYEGNFSRQIGEGGDVSHLNLTHMKKVMLEANRVYAGNVTFVHESIPLTRSTERTLVRINVPLHEV